MPLFRARRTPKHAVFNFFLIILIAQQIAQQTSPPLKLADQHPPLIPEKLVEMTAPKSLTGIAKLTSPPQSRSRS
jgi:hypothetical protein